MHFLFAFMVTQFYIINTMCNLHYLHYEPIHFTRTIGNVHVIFEIQHKLIEGTIRAKNVDKLYKPLRQLSVSNAE